MATKADYILRRLARIEASLEALEFAAGVDSYDFAEYRESNQNRVSKRKAGPFRPFGYEPPAASVGPKETKMLPAGTKGGELAKRGRFVMGPRGKKIAAGVAAGLAVGGAAAAGYKAYKGRKGRKKGSKDRGPRRRRTR